MLPNAVSKAITITLYCFHTRKTTNKAISSLPVLPTKEVINFLPMRSNSPHQFDSQLHRRARQSCKILS